MSKSSDIVKQYVLTAAIFPLKNMKIQIQTFMVFLSLSTWWTSLIKKQKPVTPPPPHWCFCWCTNVKAWINPSMLLLVIWKLILKQPKSSSSDCAQTVPVLHSRPCLLLHCASSSSQTPFWLIYWTIFDGEEEGEGQEEGQPALPSMYLVLLLWMIFGSENHLEQPRTI